MEAHTLAGPISLSEISRLGSSDSITHHSDTRNDFNVLEEGLGQVDASPIRHHHCYIAIVLSNVVCFVGSAIFYGWLFGFPNKSLIWKCYTWRFHLGWLGGSALVLRCIFTLMERDGITPGTHQEPATLADTPD